jgi:hypothetical protein
LNIGGILKKYITFAFFLALLPCLTAQADNSESFLLFKEVAHAQLDTITSDTLTMGILAHNSAFGDDNEAMTERADTLLRSRPTSEVTYAYLRSLDIIRCSQLSIITQWYNEDELKTRVKQNYEAIGQMLKQKSKNDTLLFLHAGVTIEIDGLFPEYLNSVPDEIVKLWDKTKETDSLRIFFLYLLSAKYYYRLSQHTSKSFNLITAQALLDQAKKYSHNSHNKSEIDLWEGRIKE